MKKIFMQIYLLVASVALCQPIASASDDILNLDTHKGKVIYLDFWASWCVPCRKSFPWMDDVHRANKSKGLLVIAVNLDQERRLADQFIQEFKPDFSIVFDPHGTLANHYNIKGMPSAVIIARDGKIRYQHAGFYIDKIAQYEQELQQLLAEPAL